jgi:hypothetical protein
MWYDLGREKKKELKINSFNLNMLGVDRAGIEPATHGFSGRCSTN